MSIANDFSKGSSNPAGCQTDVALLHLLSPPVAKRVWVQRVGALAAAAMATSFAVMMMSSSSAIAACSTSGGPPVNLLQCSGADADGGAINTAATPITVTIDDGANVTNASNTGVNTVDITGSADNVVLNFNMLAATDQSFITASGSNRFGVEVDLTSGTGSSTSTFNINGLVGSTQNDAINFEAENGSAVFNIGSSDESAGQILGGNEGIDISSSSFSSSRTFNATFNIDELAQVRGSDGDGISVEVYSANLFGSSGNASSTVVLDNDGRVIGGDDGLQVRVFAADTNSGVRTATVDLTVNNNSTGEIRAGDDAIAVRTTDPATGLIPSEAIQIDVDITNDNKIVAGGDGIDIDALAFGAANGQINITNNKEMGNAITAIGGDAIKILAGGTSGSVGVDVDNTKEGKIFADGDGMNITVSGVVDITNDGVIDVGGSGINVLSASSVKMTGAGGTIDAVDNGIRMITTNGNVDIIDPGKITVSDGSGIVGATSNGNTTIKTNKTVTATNGNGIYGASINGNTEITTNDVVSMTTGVDGGTFGVAANAVNGNATVTTNKLVTVTEAVAGDTVGVSAIAINGTAHVTINGGIDPPDIGGQAIATNGDAIIDVNNDIGNDVDANDIGLFGANFGTGRILITNGDPATTGETINSGRVGILAAKLGAGVTPVDADDPAYSIEIKNFGGDVLGGTGPGIAVTAADPNSILDPANAVVNNVYILNQSILEPDDSITRGYVTGSGGSLLTPTIGVVTDGGLKLDNVQSDIDNKQANAETGLTMGIVAGRNVNINNFNDATITGRALITSTGGSILFSNDQESSWTSDGISSLIAMGEDQNVTVDNLGGSTIEIKNGLLITAADENAIINNASDEYGPRSKITFGGVSANVMFAEDGNAEINNDRADFVFNGAFTGNFMIAGTDAKIVNQNEGFFNFNSVINGNFMFADQDAIIENTSGSDFLFLGLANGNYMNAERDAKITNDGAGGSSATTFTMLGLVNGNVMVADNDATITNTNGGIMTFIGLVNSGIMIADADNATGDPLLSGGDARIINTNGSTMNFIDFVGNTSMSGDREASFYNDETSTMNFVGTSNSFYLDADITFFQNEGVVNITGGLTETGITAFYGLDDFNNFGTINMVDEDPEEYLFLSGNYNAGSNWSLDAELTPGGEADLMNVRRNVTGVTHLSVNDLDSGPGQYDPEGVLFAMVGGDTDSTNFTTDGGIDKGLYRYDAYLRVDDPNIAPGDDGWYLANVLDAEAYEFPIMMAGAQSLWNETTGVWLDRTADLRTVLGEGAIDPSCAKDCMPETGNVTPGLWMKAVGGTASRDVANSSGPPPGMLGTTYDYDNSYNQDYLGFLIGADGGKEWVTGSGQNAAWLAGVMGGYSGSNLEFDNSDTTADYTAFSVGAYTTYMQGGFFIDATVKADFGNMDYDSSLGGGFSDDDSANFTSVGGVIDTGYRFGLGTMAFFEPQASLSYVHTSMDDMNVLGTDVSFDDGESLLGRLGARLGASVDGTTMRSEFYVQGSIYDEFMGDYDATLDSNGLAPSTEFDASGVYGEVAVGANVFGVGTNWNGFINGAVQFGEDDYLGYNGNVGVRYAW